MVSGKKQPAKKRRGPAPKGDYAGKAKTINTRATPDLREALEQAAKKSGRSLSQEIETRLRRTFREEDDLAKRFGSVAAARFFQATAQIMNLMRNPENPEADWLQDPYSFLLAAEVLHTSLYLVRPKEATDGFLAHGLKAELEPAETTETFWRETANSNPSLPLDPRLSFKEWFVRHLKGAIPEIVERAGERAGSPPRERLDNDRLTMAQEYEAAKLVFGSARRDK